MATSVMNTSGHLQAQLTRSLDRVLEDASLSIELKLSGRKLKEFPKTGGKYNLNDTVVADLSKNRFSELPRDVTEFSSLEELGLYHNAIRSLPQSVSQLQSLTYLDLSRNQLTHLPGGLCSLPLKVLRVANNKLNALPLDLPRLGPTLEELDADCNEIASLPPHVGQLPALRSLRLRRNLLTYLPVEITYLRLVRLDISENRISSLPVELRKMTTLVTLELSDNPLISPPASRCTRGRVHIFKYLESQALKDDKRKGVVTLTPNEESKLRRHRKPGLFSDFRIANGIAGPYNGPEEGGWQKRYTVDSGYNTSDGVDNKSWSSDVRLSSSCTEDDLDGGLTMGKIRTDQSHANKPGSLPVTNGGSVGASCFSGTSTPSTISPGESYMDLEEELAKVRISESKDGAEEVIERRRKGSGSFQEGSGKRTVGHVRFNSNGSNGVNGDSPEHYASGMQASNITDSSDPLRNNREDGKKTLEHIQTYREYKEALRQQRGQDSLSIYRPRGNSTVDGSQTPGSPVTSGYSNDAFRMENQPLDDNRFNSTQSVDNSSPLHKRAGPGDSENGQRLGRGDASVDQTAGYTVKSARNGSLSSNASTNGNGTMPSPSASMVNGGPQMHTHSPQHVSKRAPNGAASPPPYAPPPSILSPSHSSSMQGENGTKRPSALTNAGPRLVTTSVGYLGASQQTRSSLQWPPPPQPPSPSSPSSGNAAPPGDPGGATTTGDPMVRCRGGRVASVKQQLFWNRDVSPHKLTFTMRREFEKAKEEAELIDRMRSSIETRLKMTLPEELSPALSDGVVLCHLANHVRPHSVLSIHVPSPAVPKLTMARCRRNVDNFLEACRKIGVEEGLVCCASDIVEGRGLVRVAVTVAELLRFHPGRQVQPSVQGTPMVSSTMANAS